jgi:TonB family protein
MRYLLTSVLLAFPLAAQVDDLAFCEQHSGVQSAEYGLCLLKAGDMEHKLSHPKETAAYYERAVKLMPGRTETAHAVLFLGIMAIGNKKFDRSKELLNQAQSLDSSLYGPVQMWLGLMYERQNQPEDAEARYKDALAAESEDITGTVETKALYRRFLVEHGREDEARAWTAPSRTIQAPPMPKMTSEGSPYRVGGGVTAPSVMAKSEPTYSEEARVAKYSASVQLQLVVGTDGLAHDVRVVKPAGFGLDYQALATIEKWQFKPGEKDGAPVAVYATVEVNFRLL